MAVNRNISSDNVVVVYRSGDTDSEALADHYVARHGLAAEQKIAVPASNREILDTEAEFNTEVLTPLATAIGALELSGRQVWAIVLGFRIPGGFRDGDDVISSTSRVSRIGSTFSKQIRNTYFDRKDFNLFSSADRNTVRVTTRIDAPTLVLAKNMIDNAEVMEQQFFAQGTFYVDPYSDRQDTGAAEYQQEILNFVNQLLPVLNLDIFSTIFLDPYVDVVIPSVSNDVFVWSWFSDRGSLSFFKDTNTARIFFYNADDDGAFSVRALDDRRWTGLAMQKDYAATAGSMSAPGNDGFLVPSPFFVALLSGATLGEAYLFSSPFLDWTVAMFGDPLLTFSFSSPVDEINTGIDEDESMRLMFQDYARAIANYVHKSDVIEDIRNTVVLSTSISTEVDLLQLSEELLNKNSTDRLTSQFRNLSDQVFEFIRTRQEYVDLDEPKPRVDSYLTNNEFTISELIPDTSTIPNTISDENLKEVGSWGLESVILEQTALFAFYHFQIEVSDVEDFSNIVINAESISNQTGWSFEEEPNEFVSVPGTGVPSNFASNRVKYESQIGEDLPRGQTFYMRIRQRDQSTLFDFVESTEIIHT